MLVCCLIGFVTPLYFQIWNLRTGECVVTLEGHSDCARCLCVIPGQPRCIVSGGYDNAIKVRQINRPPSRAQSADRLLTSNNNARSFQPCQQVWDYVDGTCIQNLQGHTREVTCLCPLPTYDDVLPPRLISGSADASVKIWDVELGRCVQVGRPTEG